MRAGRPTLARHGRSGVARRAAGQTVAAQASPGRDDGPCRHRHGRRGDAEWRGEFPRKGACDGRHAAAGCRERHRKDPVGNRGRSEASMAGRDPGQYDRGAHRGGCVRVNQVHERGSPCLGRMEPRCRGGQTRGRRPGPARRCRGEGLAAPTCRDSQRYRGFSIGPTARVTGRGGRRLSRGRIHADRGAAGRRDRRRRCDRTA